MPTAVDLLTGAPVSRGPLPSALWRAWTTRSGNLSSDHRGMSRARKGTDMEREPDPDLASELRQGAGREWVEEAAEDERLTELLRRRRQTLGDQAKGLVNRGDRVSVEFGGHSFSGAVVAAGEDYATVEGPGQAADIKLDEARWSVLTTDTPADTEPGGLESFRAVLHEHASAGRVIRFALPGGDLVIGRVVVIATDHVEMRDVDDRQLIVPMKLILGIVRSSEFQ